MEKEMSDTKIPQTDSIEELAQFWQTHEVADFEDELEEVTEPVFKKRPETVFTIQLPIQEAELIERIAKSKGVEQTTLVRQWVLEKIHAQ
jgi:CopG antitoxin of type II toxin-antitoxin system